MTRENKLALVLGFGLMLFVCILVSDHLAARQMGPVALNTVRSDQGIPPLPPPGAGEQIVRQDGSGTARPLPADPGAGVETSNLQGSGEIASREIEATGKEREPLPETPSFKTYTIKSGDTFGAIAQREYKKKSLGEKLANYNGMKSDRLKVGAMVKLPPIGELDVTLAAAPTGGQSDVSPNTTSVASKFRVYEVKDGDTLYRIAERELGSADRWQELQSSNEALLKGSNNLKPGMQIKIPSAMTSAQTSDA